MPICIVSGGQAGVDRAALDVALALGLPVGGWCPRGRIAENGVIPPLYPLRETPSPEPAQRTAWNVRDADAVLAVLRGEPRGGTRLALEWAARLGRPHLVVEPGRSDPRAIREWIDRTRAGRGALALNVAGPREGESPGIYEAAAALLREVLRPYARPRSPTTPPTR